ncbi:helix-turn-helix transcriptional regulator [Pengzhenrongella frigida]|uniref:Helix-turn-helix transcriptional regulator n=1 Tax=Pengzhenrongella frigida TaxID=1259133 RepID=A0A4Q5MXQ1_9MICO|nr:LuxR C-terminal-related transcriptional regulator [Cellulomonas sp. HLT2-17]RYV50410.1 helix-turn-helix transcriptional regulator [Cellulomonas sp. HLT2-17]
MCIVVNELGEGEGTALVRNLGRRGTTRVVLLARRAARRELVQLLSGGLRGAVAADPRRMQLVPGAPRPVAPAPAPVPVAEPAPAHPELTARELGVLKLVADGRSNRNIGEDLGLSALTVKSHLARISRKLGTGDRAELVATVIRSGLMP